MANPYTTLEAINSFVVGLKSDGVWSKITEAYLMAGVTFGGITVKLKGTGTLTNNNFVSGDYQATGTGAGLTGNGSSKYLDTGLLDSSLSADDKSFGAYVTGYVTANRCVMGSVTGTAWQTFITSITNAQHTMPSTDATVNGSISGGVGHVIGSRRGVNDVETYYNGASNGTDTSTASASNSTSSWYLFARNLSDSPFFYADYTLTFAHIGTGLTDTDASNLTNRVETLMDALGCGVIS